METSRNWSGSEKNVVRRDGCSDVLRVLKGYDDQPPSVEISMVGVDDSKKKEQDETDNSAPNPWMERFISETGSKPTTIISQLNNYHRYGSMNGTDEPGDPWNAKNKVTPPSGALKSPWEDETKEKSSTVNYGTNYSRGPPPLLLSASNPACISTVSRPSTSANASVKELHPLPPKKGVPHVYHDFSNVPDAVGVVRKKTGGVTQPFPEKLHTMLDNDDDPSVVSWLPHGRAFLVRKPTEFTSQIMPKYFRQTKLTSFQRQLNLYGFRRLTQGADSGAYYHELFLRGRPQLCLRMQRQKIKGTGHKQPADVQTEPNFYAMVPSEHCKETTMETTNNLTPKTRTVSHSGSVVPRDRACSSVSFAELSPASKGVHGAAHLLNGMKTKKFSAMGQSMLASSSVLDKSTISSSASLNEPNLQQSNRTSSPASSLSTTQSTNQTSSPILTANYELYDVPEERSMSLLGRVQYFSKPLKKRHPSSSIIDASSSSHWPPSKHATNESPSHTTATYESTIASFPSPTHPYLPFDDEGVDKPPRVHQFKGTTQRTNTGQSTNIQSRVRVIKFPKPQGTDAGDTN